MSARRKTVILLEVDADPKAELCPLCGAEVFRVWSLGSSILVEVVSRDEDPRFVFARHVCELQGALEAEVKEHAARRRAELVAKFGPMTREEALARIAFAERMGGSEEVPR